MFVSLVVMPIVKQWEELRLQIQNFRLKLCSGTNATQQAVQEIRHMIAYVDLAKMLQFFIMWSMMKCLNKVNQFYAIWGISTTDTVLTLL